MKLSKEELRKAMRLYAVTDSMWLNGRTLEEVVEETLQAGTTFLQIREKNLNPEAFEALARRVRKKAEKYHIPFVVNDEVELAAHIDADGVHIGQSDMELARARRILGPDKIIGVSAQTVEQALRAERGGADYLGVGAVFSTSTKADASEVSLEQLKAICETVSIPVVAIGGIGRNNIQKLKGTGIDGVAVVSAIFASGDIPGATSALRAETEKMLEG